jgi:hypothetical protein
MPDWITANLNLISTLSNMAMLLVWVFYARLFYKNFSRQRNPLIFIHRTFGESLNPDCLVVNLSSDTIHILCVMMTLHTKEGAFTTRITEYSRLAPNEAGRREQPNHRQLMEIYKQGPLPSGHFLNLDTFRTMILTVKTDAVDGHFGKEGRSPSLGELVESTSKMDIRVVALYGHFEKPVAARRTFRLNHTPQGLEVLPTMLLTKQYHSYWQRRIAQRWLAKCP